MPDPDRQVVAAGKVPNQTERLKAELRDHLLDIDTAEWKDWLKGLEKKGEESE